MDFSIFDVIDNGVSNQEISEKITQKLKEKYNEEFSVKMNGNRYGTSDDNTVTTYCSPLNNENLVFTATLDKEQINLEDDYYLKSISFELENFIKNEFKNDNIDISIKSEIIGLNKLPNPTTLSDFIIQNPSSSFLSYIVSNSDISDEYIEKLLKNLNSNYQNIYFKSYLYSVDKFEEYVEISSTLPSTNSSIIKRFSPKQESLYKLFEGTITKIN